METTIRVPMSPLERDRYRVFFNFMFNGLPNWTPETHDAFLLGFRHLLNFCILPWNTEDLPVILNGDRLHSLYSRRLAEEECSVCYSLDTIDIISVCRHVFCLNCVRQWSSHVQTSNLTCPYCRTILGYDDLTFLSTKLSFVLQRLREIINVAGSFKIVVTAAITSSLQFLHHSLRGLAIDSTLFDAAEGEWENTVENFIQSDVRILLLPFTALQGVITLPPNSILFVPHSATLGVKNYLFEHVRTEGIHNTLLTSFFVAEQTIEEVIMFQPQVSNIIVANQFVGQVFADKDQISAILDVASFFPD